MTSVSSTSKSPWDFCYEILPDVSRTFALTIPALDRPLRDSVCVAYLLCRIADTIEDRDDLELEDRLWFYRQFADLAAQPPSARSAHVKEDERIAAFLRRWPPEQNPSYQNLTVRMGEVIAAYASLDDAQRKAVNDCVQEMIAGMSQMTHQPPIDGVVYVCDDLEQLEQYCHYVAGTVGIMLTRLFDAHMASNGEFATEPRIAQGRQFGLGLQLTNILKDHRTDLDRGTSFIPRQWWDEGDGLASVHRDDLARRTLSHLAQGQDYVLALPPEHEHIRLFCLWALWMAVPTVREVLRARACVPKISRLEVAEIIAFSRQNARDDHKIRAKFESLRDEAAALLTAA